MPKFLDVSNTEAAREYLGVKVFDVTAYGAVGDGVADDTAEIHLARDAAGVGRTLLFPAGTYLVDGLTASVADQTWELQPGAVIKMKTGAANALVVSGAGVTVTGGTFDGSNGTVNDWGYDCILITADGVSLHGVTVEDSSFHGIGAFNSSGVSIDRCTISNSWGTGIWIQNDVDSTDVTDISVTNNHIDVSTGNETTGIGIAGNDSNRTLSRMTISQNMILVKVNPTAETAGIYVRGGREYSVSDNVVVGGNYGFSCPTATRAVFSGNKIHKFKTMGMELPFRQSKVSVVGNIINPDGVEVNGSSGITTSNDACDDLVIAGNTIGPFTARGVGVRFNTGSTIDGCTVVGNHISGGGDQFSGVLANAAVSNLVVSGNVIDGTGSPDSDGVQLLRAAAGISVTGNHFTSITTGAVRFVCGTAVSQDHITIAGNGYVSSPYSFVDNNYGAGASALGTNIVADSSAAATANTLALRDAQGNIFADAFSPSLTSTATAAGTTTLTVDSREVQVFTGSTTQTCVLPTTGITAGRRFAIVNSSSGAVTVNASGGGTVATLLAGTSGIFTSMQSTPTTAAHWASSLSNLVTLTGTQTISGKTLTDSTLTSPKVNKINDTNGNTALSVNASSNAVNYLWAINSAAGNNVKIAVSGADTNVNLAIQPRGSGFVVVTDSSANHIARFNQSASPVNYWTFSQSATGNPVTANAQGTDTNIGINFISKGSGTVQANGNPVGVKVAVPASAGATGVPGQWAAESGWLYICVAANTWERVAIASW